MKVLSTDEKNGLHDIELSHKDRVQLLVPASMGMGCVHLDVNPNNGKLCIIGGQSLIDSIEFQDLTITLPDDRANPTPPQKTYKAYTAYFVPKANADSKFAREIIIADSETNMCSIDIATMSEKWGLEKALNEFFSDKKITAITEQKNPTSEKGEPYFLIVTEENA